MKVSYFTADEQPDPRPLIEMVGDYIAARDMRPNTAQAYRQAVSHFARWMEAAGKDPNKTTSADVVRYKFALQDRHAAAATIAMRLTLLCKFFEWVSPKKGWTFNPAEGIRRPRVSQNYKRKPLTPEQAAQLLTYVKNKERVNRRDYAIISIMLRTGLRCHEVAALNVSDLKQRGDRWILQVKGKGRDDYGDFVILSPKALDALNAYIATKPNPRPMDPLFTIHDRKDGKEYRITLRALERLIRLSLAAIGLHGPEYTPHSLRHTAATTILKNGGTLADVQEILRHKKPETTRIYVGTLKEELRLTTAKEDLTDEVF